MQITDSVALVTAADVTLLINNAGVATFQDLLTGDIDKIRLEMETHYFGTLSMVRAFAPILARNGGGSIVNVMSVLSWLSPLGATSCAPATEVSGIAGHLGHRSEASRYGRDSVRESCAAVIWRPPQAGHGLTLVIW